VTVVDCDWCNNYTTKGGDIYIRDGVTLCPWPCWQKHCALEAWMKKQPSVAD